LYNKVLGDAISQVPEGSPITIIPDGLLALLPFEALVTGGKAQWNKGSLGDYPEGLTFLGDRHPLIYYQSITALTLARAAKRSPKGPGRVLIMADPVFEMADARLQETRPEIKVVQRDQERQISLMAAMEEDSGGSFVLKRLEGTERLAKSLERLYGSSCEVYTGLDATKGRLMEKLASELTRYDAIVFATHGFAGNDIPGIMEPVLALTMVPPGTDGFLTMNEVAGLKTNADIVALTACQTGVGVHLAGEGVLSIGRSFQCAGARAVAMSLWSVSEDSSVALMDEFFKRLRAGKPRLEAWTEARAQVRKAGFEHPFYWASFVLVGEAR
jgi:CHAT domain-containing protein